MKGGEFTWQFKKITHPERNLPVIPSSTRTFTTKGRSLPKNNSSKGSGFKAFRPKGGVGDFNEENTSSWWLNQPIWKICSSKWKSSLNRGEHKNNLKPPTRHVCPGALWFYFVGVKSLRYMSCTWQLSAFFGDDQIVRYTSTLLRLKKRCLEFMVS